MIWKITIKSLPDELSAPASAASERARRRYVLLSACTALMAVIASVTGLNVAQPSLARDLHATHGSVMWMINIYTITLASLLLPLGAAGDRRGRKRVLMIGLLVFGLANGLAAIVGSTSQMLAVRVLAGIGAAMIMPVTLSVITTTFPPGERSKAIGIWTAAAGGGGILGMFISALLVDTIGWRWLFALPVLLALGAGILTARSVPNSRGVAAGRFDVAGSILAILGVVGRVVFLHEGARRGWASPLTLAGLALGLSAGLGFVARERGHPAPLFDISPFGTRSLNCGAVTILLWFGVQAGVFVVLYPFFQISRSS